MASIRPRTARDGTTRYAVLWRENNKQRSLTFDDEKVAERFKLDLEIDGYDIALERLRANVGANPGATSTEHTLTTWMEHYIDHLTGVHEGTREDYHRLYRRTWKPLIGRLPLRAVRRDQVAAATNKLVARGLARKSIANARGLLSAAMDVAVLDELADRNPCRGLKLPRVGEHEKQEMVFLTPDEWDAVYTHVDPYYRPLARFLVGTGARWGEATALQVGDINVDTAEARIVRAWKRIPGQLVLGPPKTRRSRRTVIMPPEVVDDLRPLVTGRPKGDLLFRTQRGGIIHSDPFRRRYWWPALDKAEQDEHNPLTRRPRIHDLRHSHAAWLISAGVPLTVVQRRLGHESITTTSDIYGHLLPDVIAASADAASQVFTRLETGAKQLPGPADEQAEADEDGDIVDAEVEDDDLDEGNDE